MVTTDPEPITVSVSTPIPVELIPAKLEMLPHTGNDTFIIIGVAIVLIAIGSALLRKSARIVAKNVENDFNKAVEQYKKEQQ